MSKYNYHLTGQNSDFAKIMAKITHYQNGRKSHINIQLPLNWSKQWFCQNYGKICPLLAPQWLTMHTHTLLSSSTPLMPLIFLSHISLSSQVVLLCCFKILILKMVSVMALTWCCLRSENGSQVYSFGSGNVIFIELRHCQFPVCLAFVMTINKAQGQSIYYVGIDLCVPVFSHVMLLILAALLQIEWKSSFLWIQIQLWLQMLYILRFYQGCLIIDCTYISFHCFCFCFCFCCCDFCFNRMGWYNNWAQKIELHWYLHQDKQTAGWDIRGIVRSLGKKWRASDWDYEKCPVLRFGMLVWWSQLSWMLLKWAMNNPGWNQVN